MSEWILRSAQNDKGGAPAEAIYKDDQMHTVGGMLKRFLIIVCGAACGVLLATAVARLAPAWNWWPSRSLDRDAAYFRSVLKLVAENYVEEKEADGDRLTRAALEGMLRSLDPHSEFLRAEAYQGLREEMDGKFGGIGIQVERRDGKVVVIAPVADSPGERAGMQRGDQIVEVDGQSVEKLSMDKIVERLRGKPKTQVRVLVFRPSKMETKEFTITREIIRVVSVRDARLLSDGIGYVQVTHFSERTGAEFKEAWKQLQAEHARALILDLRNNPGGLLDAAVGVAEPFFRPREMIVYTQGRTAANREEHRASRAAGGLDLPVAVLVNAGTASAAEVVAGALKDTGRAVVLGETTFGKGSVQTVFRLKNGEALRLTTARYYTPSGVSIHEKGIEPQVAVMIPLEDEAKLRLQRARRDLTDPREFAARFGFEPIEDRLLQAALDVLKGVELITIRSRPPPGKTVGP
jgi:carboxyl-terminal processing protease